MHSAVRPHRDDGLSCSTGRHHASARSRGLVTFCANRSQIVLDRTGRHLWSQSREAILGTPLYPVLDCYCIILPRALSPRSNENGPS